MRALDFSGAQRLWGSINSVVDHDCEPTEPGMLSMDRICDEMNAAYKELKERYGGK